MKASLLSPILLLLICSPLAAEPATSKAAIYDEQADGTKQIEDALATAKKENKRVLLQFGANWCGWCHRLHTLFEKNEEIANRLKASFVVVMIDVNKDHNRDLDQRYGHPTQFGLPAIVILDSNGKNLFIQDTGKLEEGDHHDPKKVIAFLDRWAVRK